MINTIIMSNFQYAYQISSEEEQQPHDHGENGVHVVGAKAEFIKGVT